MGLAFPFSEEIGVTTHLCCSRYCLSGPGNLGFYLPVPQLGLEILNIVVSAPVNEYKEDDPTEKERLKDSGQIEIGGLCFKREQRINHNIRIPVKHNNFILNIKFYITDPRYAD